MVLDKEIIKKIVNFLNQHEDLLANNDLDKLYECFPYKSTKKVAYLTEFLWDELKLGNDMLNYMTVIPEDCFYNLDFIDEVIIPENIEKIEDKAFANSYIKNVVFNTKYCSLGNHVFFWCFDLQKVTLSEGLTEIGYGMFYGCKSLKNIQIPDYVTIIEGDAFRNCNNLESIYLSHTVTTIGSNAFYNCDNIIIKTPKRNKNNSIKFEKEEDKEFFEQHVIYV